MTTRDQLTRTCTACGIEKPLSAFLQISGTKGTTYGTICATCRSTGIKEKSEAMTREEGHSSASAGSRIGAKEKVGIEKELRREQQERENRAEKATQVREETAAIKQTAAEQKLKDERAHHTAYLEAKKGLLNYQSKKSTVNNFALNHDNGERSFSSAPLTDEKQLAVEEVLKNTTQNWENERLTKLDLSGAPVVDQQHMTISRDNPLIRQFKIRLGDAPINRTEMQMYKRPQAQQQQKNSQKQKAAETPREFIEKYWGPSSRKR